MTPRRMRCSAALMAAFTGLAAFSAAIEVSLETVMDIHPGDSGSSPMAMALIGDRLYFSADAGDGTSREPYVSDGTPGGTRLIRDIATGPFAFSSPTGFAGAPGQVFFAASTTPGLAELWKTDGTQNGTERVAAGSTMNPTGLTYLGGVLFYFAENSAAGRELWRSNGTTLGTSMVRDINPGTASSIGSQVQTAAIGTTLFFAADDGSTGLELWRSQGMSGNTVRVADLAEGAASSFPANLTVQGTSLFFTASASGQRQLYATSEAGGVTGPLGPAGTYAVAATDATVLFTNGIELWKSDGTPGGTEMVVDLTSSASSTGAAFIDELTGSGQTGFFVFNGDGAGRELWKTDGTASGTMQVADILPGANGSDPAELRPFGPGSVVFTAYDETHGREVWLSDGSPGGTTLVREVIPGPNILTRPALGPTGGGRLWFAANNGMNGTELWMTDGTSAGTVQVSNINTQAAGSSPSGFAAFSGGYLFAATSELGRELWHTDGTADGTRLVADIFPGVESSGPSDFLVMGDVAIFAAHHPTLGREVFRTDGTAEGTVLAADVQLGPLDSSPRDFNVLPNGTVVFAATTSDTGEELFALQPGRAVPQLIRDFREGSAGSDPGNFYLMDSKLYFTATSSDFGREYFFTDGTIDGTDLLKDITPGMNLEGPSLLGGMLGDFWFSADDGFSSIELFRSNGTADGTVRITDINPAGASNPHEMCFGEQEGSLTAYFLANDGGGDDVWSFALGTDTPQKKVEADQFDFDLEFKYTLSNGVDVVAGGEIPATLESAVSQEVVEASLPQNVAPQPWLLEAGIELRILLQLSSLEGIGPIDFAEALYAAVGFGTREANRGTGPPINFFFVRDTEQQLFAVIETERLITGDVQRLTPTSWLAGVFTEQAGSELMLISVDRQLPIVEMGWMAR